MRYKKVPKGLLEETKALVRFYLFLRDECGLKAIDKISFKELKCLLLTCRQQKS